MTWSKPRVDVKFWACLRAASFLECGDCLWDLAPPSLSLNHFLSGSFPFPSACSLLPLWKPSTCSAPLTDHLALIQFKFIAHMGVHQGQPLPPKHEAQSSSEDRWCLGPFLPAAFVCLASPPSFHRLPLPAAVTPRHHRASHPGSNPDLSSCGRHAHPISSPKLVAHFQGVFQCSPLSSLPLSLHGSKPTEPLLRGTVLGVGKANTALFSRDL